MFATFRGTAIAFDEAAPATRFAIAKDDLSIEMHDGTSTMLLPKAHDSRIVTMSWHGHLLASGGKEDGVRIWDSASSKILRQIDVEPAALAWSPSGRWLAVATDAHVRIYDASTFVLRQILWAGEAMSLSWRNDDVTLAIGSKSGRVDVFECRTGMRIAKFVGKTGAVRHVGPVEVDEAVGSVTRVDWSADGMQILAASSDGAVKLWDIVRGGLSRDVQIPSERLRATAALCGEAMVLADETRPARRIPFEPANSASREIALDVRGTSVVVSRQGALAILDQGGSIAVDQSLPCASDATSHLAPFELAQGEGAEDQFGGINKIAWSPDGRLLAATAMETIDAA
jgi:hypothetical protein